jgi:hypothetical protein
VSTQIWFEPRGWPLILSIAKTPECFAGIRHLGASRWPERSERAITPKSRVQSSSVPQLGGRRSALLQWSPSWRLKCSQRPWRAFLGLCPLPIENRVHLLYHRPPQSLKACSGKSQAGVRVRIIDVPSPGALCGPSANRDDISLFVPGPDLAVNSDLRLAGLGAICGPGPGSAVGRVRILQTFDKNEQETKSI